MRLLLFANIYYRMEIKLLLNLTPLSQFSSNVVTSKVPSLTTHPYCPLKTLYLTPLCPVVFHYRLYSRSVRTYTESQMTVHMPVFSFMMKGHYF